MPSFTVSAATPGNAVPSRDFPVLEAGNTAYPLGEYEAVFAKIEGKRSAYSVQHLIRNAPLISRLLKSGQARYACAVSSPKSSYRAVCVSDAPRQEARWNEDDLGELPLFTPMILSYETMGITLSSERDGVDELWDGCKITLEKGSRLAIGMVIEREMSLGRLLEFEEDKEMHAGGFKVVAPSDPFRFKVLLDTRLFRYLESANRDRKGGLRENIMTHIVTACFALLQRNFSDEEEWNAHRELRALAEELTRNGLPIWDEEEFHPETAATTLYPHTFESDDPNGGDE